MEPQLDSPKLRLYLDDAEAVDDLFRQALDKMGHGAFGDFLDFLARFRRHSIFNAMLIRVQRPGALAVGSRQQWARFGRTPRSDAVPIIILQPFGPVEFVYEQGDTEGAALPGFDAWNSLSASGKVSADYWGRAVQEAKRCGIAIELVNNYGAGLAGTAAAHSGSDQGHTEIGAAQERFRIKLNAGMNEPSRFATLGHELAHIYCGHLGGDPRNRWPDRSSVLTIGQRELEAEAAAWLVCRRAGVETRSADYLSGYISNDDDLKIISSFAIMAAANRIEARAKARK